MLSNTLRLNFCYLKIIYILHPRNHPKKTGHIPKNKQKNMYVCIYEIIRLIIMKMKMKMKNKSHRFEINRLRSTHGHKHNRFKWCLPRMMMLLCIKQHLSNIGSSIHEKVKQHWGWVDKTVASKKKCVQDHIILKIFTLEGVYTWNFIPGRNHPCL